ncbi:MAG: ferredoxin [Candidatus Atabeyarchaeum deiterrae]
MHQTTERREGVLSEIHEVSVITFVIVQEACHGCGLCESTCPEIFEVRQDGKCHVRESSRVNAATCAEEAAIICPASAIIRIE